MCHPTRCKKCGKTTWAGCGKHVADVRARISADQWCAGHADTHNDTWLRRQMKRR